MTIDPVIVAIVRVGLGWLFIASAAHKFADAAEFRSVLAMYRVLPDRLVAIAARVIAVVEAGIGLGALLQQAWAYVAAVAVLLGYAAAMGVNLARGRRFIDCGCGGTAQPLSVGLVVRNLALAVGAIAAMAPVLERSLGWIDLVTITAGVLVVGAVYGAVNQLLAARARLEEWV